MVHLPSLISDLGLILATAGITTLLFKKIRQPVVLGYILAGILVGRYFAPFPTVADEEAIRTWAEIGVIILLFNLGLEFSFKKLLKVGGAASVTALVKVSFMLLAGYFVGKALGWATMDCIFLGGILSISSTTIIIRAFDELGIKHKHFAQLVFGVLIVEDLVAILLLVLLSTVAVSQQFAGTEMIYSVLKLAFFLTLWFIGGIFIIPTILRQTRRLLNDETMLIISLALCFLMVMLATAVGFSAALGAFIMGSILAETTQAERIEHLMKSVRDLFGAVFFVSIGMLIDPRVLIDYAGPIAVLTVFTLTARLVSAAGGAVLAGESLRTGVQAGLSLGPVGEFSFIIATLGLTLKVTSDFLYPIAVAISAITTFGTPYLIRHSGAFYGVLERRLPQRWAASLNRYSSSTRGITEMSDWKVLLRGYAVRMAVHALMLSGIIVLSREVLLPWADRHVELEPRVVTVTIAFALMSPFLYGLALQRIQRTAFSHLWLNSRYSRGPLIAVEVFRVFLAVLFVFLLLNVYFRTLYAAITAALLFGLVAFIFARRLQHFYHRLEQRFLSNLFAREKANPPLAPWDAHLAELVVSTESPIIGTPLAELALRERYGVNIALIERGPVAIPTPGRDERLFPHDRLVVIGTDDQIAQVKLLVEFTQNRPDDEAELLKSGLALERFRIYRNSSWSNKSIRDSTIREKTHGLIVGIERDGERLLNPDSSVVLLPGDIVWIVGNKKAIREMNRQPPKISD